MANSCAETPANSAIATYPTAKAADRRFGIVIVKRSIAAAAAIAAGKNRNINWCGKVESINSPSVGGA
jgi:hypothetical protein